MRLFYYVINIFKKKKPYFSKEKFLKNTSRYTKREINKNHFDNIMIDLLSNNDVWFNVLDGEELVQISRDEFVFKKKVKIFHLNILKYWVEWKSKKGVK
jgi:hypothetical protein